MILTRISAATTRSTTTIDIKVMICPRCADAAFFFCFAIEGVEMQTNIASNGSYTTLQTPTAAQNNLLTTWDKPPYTPTADGIPFVDFANKYVLGGASYNPGLLQGLSLQTIAGSLAQPTSAPAKAIIGTANIITATVCKIDNNQPSNVCNLGYIQQIEKTLK